MADQNDDKRNINSSRRDFLRQSGLLAVGAAVSRFSFASDNDQDKPKLPEVHVKSSSAWIAGEEEFLDDSRIDASDPAKVNVDLDTPFYLASPTKLLVDLVLLSALDGRYKDIQISPDEELVMSPYALMRSTNSAFANLTKDNFILLDGKKTDTIPVHKSREWLTAFSLNDVTQALVERIANGRQIESGLSIGKSVRLEQKFIAEYINPLLEELGMSNTRIRTSTGLRVNPKNGNPAHFENYTTHRDMMRLANAMHAEFPDEFDVYRNAEVRIDRVFKDPDSGKWLERYDRFANDTPNLETSVEAKDPKAASIPIEGVDSGKSGLNNLALWQALQRYDLGHGKHLYFFTTGDGNDTYATHPKQVLENALAQIKPTITPKPEKDIDPDAPTLIA